MRRLLLNAGRTDSFQRRLQRSQDAASVYFEQIHPPKFLQSNLANDTRLITIIFTNICFNIFRISLNTQIRTDAHANKYVTTQRTLTKKKSLFSYFQLKIPLEKSANQKMLPFARDPVRPPLAPSSDNRKKVCYMHAFVGRRTKPSLRSKRYRNSNKNLVQNSNNTSQILKVFVYFSVWRESCESPEAEKPTGG